MKFLYLALVLFLLVPNAYAGGYGYGYTPAYPARSGWNYVHYERGFYVKSNGFQNDGWWWKLDHCGRWYKHSKIAEAIPDIDSPTFERDVLKFIEKRETREYRAAVLEKLGISSAQYSHGGPSYSGTSYIKQGFFSGGSTIQGVGAASGYPVIDPRPLIQEQQMLMDRQQTLNGQMFAGTNALVSQYTDIARIQASASAFASGYAAAVQAAQPPREEVHQYKIESEGVKHQSSISGQGSFKQLANMIGDGLHRQDCAGCHKNGGTAPDLDVVRSGKDFDEFKKDVERRLRLPKSDPQHMPKDGREYSEEEIVAYLLSMGE